MIDKYLPIGTVCTLKGSNKKTMIVGFMSIEYNGNIKMYDYEGCAYPEGLLLKNRLISFKHSDIEKIDFLGYKDILHDKFNKILLNNTKELDLEDDNKKTIANFQFDENGVIIFDSSANLQTGVANPETKDTSINNPFNIEYKSVARAINPNKDQILSPYTFDENGIITGDKLAEAASPFVFDENGVIVEEKGQQKKPKYEFKFDENGIIIDEKLVEEEIPYVFDENGVIVEEKGQPKDNESGFEFDENGIVIDDGSAKDDSPYVFDENGVIIEEKGQSKANESEFKFDENGIIIDDGSSDDSSSASEKNNEFKFDKNGVIVEENGEKAPETKTSSKYKFNKNGVVISE